MATMEKIEIARYRGELEEDLEHLVGKYCRIMSWESPELDEAEARRLIVEALQQAAKQLPAA